MSDQGKFDELRRRAEVLLAEGEIKEPEESEDVFELIQELKIHQIELEMQNEELQTAQNELETLNREYTDLYEFAPCGYITLTPKGIISKSNLQAVMFLREERVRLQGMGLSSYIAKDYQDVYIGALRRAEETQEKTTTELMFKRKDDSDKNIWARADITAVTNEKGEIDAWRLTLIDISGKKEDEFALIKANKEKDLLRSELNHRVKNNLLAVRGLINMKNNTLGDKADLSDILGRVDAIMLLHQNMIETSSHNRINTKKYIVDLLKSIFILVPSSTVNISCEFCDNSISSKNSVPIGLIINELATNAMKHGFIPGEEACFSLDLSKDKKDDLCILTISHSGNPFPEDVDIHNSQTMGLKLINALVTQLNGTVELKKKPNPMYTIRFPVEK